LNIEAETAIYDEGQDNNFEGYEDSVMFYLVSLAGFGFGRSSFMGVKVMF
jgi:hypothetical protein